jgi:hypothetical protein
MSDEQNKISSNHKSLEPQTVIKSLSLGGIATGGAVCAVDCKDGKIIRIRPFHYDWKYKAQELNPWKIQRTGMTIETQL